MASAVISTLLSELTSKLKEEVGLVYGVDEELRDLSSTFLYIESVLDDAEEKQTTDRAVKEWLDELQNVFYDVDDVLDECRYEALRRKSTEADGIIKQVCNFFLSCFLLNPIRFRGNVAHRVKEIKKRVDRILRDGERFKLKEKVDVENRPISDIVGRPPSSSVIVEDSQSEFVGRGDDIRRIMELLVPDEPVTVISIVGMGGLGKTTLAQLVYKNVRKDFQVTAWVCVSEAFDISRLTKEIIELATQESPKSSTIEAMQCDLQQILSGKRFLIVLDDVWNTERHPWGHAWERLRPPFSYGAEGSKILVTTRNEEVSRIMRGDHIYHLPVLSHYACWSLFTRHAFARHAFAGGNYIADPELINIGRELVEKRCKGLPLAVKVLGDLLYSITVPSYWKRILGSQPWSSVEGESGELMKALRMSYHHLPPPIKHCFAFCSIFPKDHKFKKDALVRFWMAHGFIQPRKGMKTSLEETGSEYFKILLSRSFFQEDQDQEYQKEDQDQEYQNQIYYYKMHDCIHDLAMLVSREECFRFEPGISPTNDYRHLSFIECENIMRTQDFHQFYACKNLRTFILQCVWMNMADINQVTGDWIVNLRCLRLLVLTNTTLTKLPGAISNLIHLRCLDLSTTNITQLPESVSSLYHLETLNLEECSLLCQLPKETRKLVNLRHLNLNGCDSLERMPPEMGKLTCLQTLPRFMVGRERGCGMRELSRFMVGRDRGCGMRELSRFMVGRDRGCGMRELSRFMVGRDRGCGIGQLKGLKALKGAISIGNLSNVSNAREAEEANLKGKTDIEKLQLLWWDSPWEDGTTTNKLQHDRALLEEEGKILEALQPHTNIKSLSIWEYRGLNYPRWLQHTALPNLVELDLRWCRNCNSIPPLGRLQKLENLSIQANYNLEEWCEPEGGEFLSLRSLDIPGCPKLRTMPKYFSTLKSLNLYECLQLACLPYSPSLDELNLHCCNESLLSQVFLLTSLSTLTIRRFEELKSLPGDMLQRLRNLKKLTIEDCPELLSLLDEGLPIQSLSMDGCQKLRTTGPDELGEGMSSGGGEFLSLQSLHIACCPKLRTMPNYSPSLDKLYLVCCNEILLSQVSLLTSLSTLTIGGFKELKSLPGDMLQHLGNLKELIIEDCPELRSLPDGVLRIPSRHIFGCRKLRSTGPDELGEGTSSGG